MADEEEKARLLTMDRPTGPISLRPGIYGFFGEYRWLSNFHIEPLLIDEAVWSSVEHVYQASKSGFCSDDFQDRVDLVEEIYKAREPRETKQIARKFKLDIERWELVKRSIMRRCVLIKFASNKELMQKLLATGDLYLEEANWWRDQCWGTYRGVGENRLGKIIMEVRTILS